MSSDWKGMEWGKSNDIQVETGSNIKNRIMYSAAVKILWAQSAVTRLEALSLFWKPTIYFITINQSLEYVMLNAFHNMHYFV
jgi:Zn-dependent metalloprotease